MLCPACQSKNSRKAVYCRACGRRLAMFCCSCGKRMVLGAQFCSRCGLAVGMVPPAQAQGVPVQVVPQWQPVAQPPPVQPPLVRPPSTPPAAPSPGAAPAGAPEQVAAPDFTAAAPKPKPDEPPAPPAEDPILEQLKRLVPKEYADKLLGARGKAQGDRRLVSILFSDVKGSTKMAESLDPEDVMEIMNGAFEYLISPIYKYEGTLARLMGDAILAFFGAPIAHEDDAERAIKAALEIISGVQIYAARLAEERGIEGFNVRVGINTGLVVMGEVGSDLRVEYTAMGDAINLAARMEQNAPIGGVMISHNTYQHVLGVFDVKALEPIVVKGKSEPVRVYQVERAKPRAYRRRLHGVAGIATRLIGRDGELKLMEDALRLAVEGERQMVTVSGDPGVGKSRLLDEFDNWVELFPTRVHYFRGRANHEMQSLPYSLLRDLFTFQFEIQDSDSTAAVQGKLEAGFAEAFGSEEQGLMKAHFISRLLGFDVGESIHLAAVKNDPRQLRERAQIYLTEYFRAISAAAPTLVLLEDVQWADDSSLDLVNHFGLALPSQRILIICAARPALFERRPRWGEGQTYHSRLDLRPLTRLDSRRLVDEILQRVPDIPAALRELVLSGAEGNPLYVEELIKMLIEERVIIPSDTEEKDWQIDLDRLAEMRVPPTLMGVLQSRIDGLPPEERSVLQWASVVGRTFWDKAIARIGGLAADGAQANSVPCVLSELRGKEMVFHRESSTFSEAEEYIFKHAVLREVAYESVLKKVRKGYHALAAEWLVEYGGERVDEYCGLIAEHLESAGQTERAIEYLIKAADQATRQYANAEAAIYYGRAIQLLPEADHARRYPLLLGNEKAHDLLGQRGPQEEDIKALEAAALALEDLHLQAEAALRRAAFSEVTSNYPAEISAAQQAIELAQKAGDLAREAEAHYRWGSALVRQGDYINASQQLEQAQEMAQKAGAAQVEADVLRNLGSVSLQQSEYDKARGYYEDGLNIYRRVGDRRGEGASLNNLGVLAWRHHPGEPDLAQGYYERGLRLSRETGNRQHEGVFLGNLGPIYSALGDLPGAQTCYEQGLTIAQEVADRLSAGMWIYYQGEICFWQGNYALAHQRLKGALETFTSAGLRVWMALAHYRLGRLLWLAGDFKASKEQAAKAVELTTEARAQSEGIRCLMTLSMACQALGEQEPALEHARRAVDQANESKMWVSQGYALKCLSRVLQEQGALEEAAKSYQEEVALWTGTAGGNVQYCNLRAEAQAGLAAVRLAQGDGSPETIQLAQEAFGWAKQSPLLYEAFEPARVYLNLYRVLHACGDPQAVEALQAAQGLLKTQATHLGEDLDPNLFAQVPTNAEIFTEFATLSPAPTS